MAKNKVGKKTSLKAALSSQQTRLKKKQEAAHAADLINKATQSKAKGKAKATPLRPTIPFHSTDRILLIGEGNFSFAHALVADPPANLEYLPGANVTATAYDTEVECYGKYPDAAGIVNVLRERGMEVLFGVDATKLEKCAALKGRRWDRIVWNFPHAGKGIADQDRNILSNQLLLLRFLRSTAHFLAAGPTPSVNQKRNHKRTEDDDGDDAPSDAEEDALDGDQGNTSIKTRGTVLITLRDVLPYTAWDVPKLAKNPPPPSGNEEPSPRYIQLRSFVFHRKLWKGYGHRMTKGERAHGQGTTGHGGEDRTWEFCLADS
ncbi:uncharacterized protein LAESUDRAFT_723465 [Laetiporus sulphureus 93-53]|uniref:25S rRNA (uridine-N(3))-methyltransferase BMT5-like domain-containing protein n=1 Tax=Laetiporus sulphureus 93-53 TaxID=1314785 RepID=A0A165F8H6_9APHY|nr:uncharacterized protein LAESUDRAFT_723465 [Laetiporus sulphureus 93-53]KZT08590.1 hypothetical protein LAESUDRAFT_723465 [Laetiporus sulphureus 93-53]